MQRRYDQPLSDYDNAGGALLLETLDIDDYHGNRFRLSGVPFHVVCRLNPPDDSDDSPQTYRYLGVGDTGRQVCLTVTPDWITEAFSEGRLDSFNVFLSEPAHLIALEEVERTTQTNFFPRLLSKVIGVNQGAAAYAMEYVPGISILDVSPDKILSYRRLFMHAIQVAHMAGIGFHDLLPDDLRILPDGSVKILDFNLSFPPDEDEAQYDFDSDFSTLDHCLNTLIHPRHKQ